MKNKAMITQLIRWVRWAAVSLILIGLSTRLLAEVNWAQRNIEAIGIVVTDAPKAAKVYHQLLGINDWVLVDLDVQGEDLPAGIRVARGQFNGVLIELLQPLYGDSAIRRYLAREGEGIFHLEVSGQGVSALADAYTKGYRPLLNVTTSSGYSAQWIDSWERLGVNLKLRTSEPDLMVGWGKCGCRRLSYPCKTCVFLNWVWWSKMPWQRPKRGVNYWGSAPGYLSILNALI